MPHALHPCARVDDARPLDTLVGRRAQRCSMKTGTLWTWIGAAAIGVGLTATANADPWDRDRDDGGASRMQELRQAIASRDIANRPSMERSITGHQLGRDTVTMGDFKRDFKDRNDMLSHMGEQTKQRAS